MYQNGKLTYETKKFEENNLLSLCDNEKNPSLFLSEAVIACYHPTPFSYICSQMCFGGQVIYIMP